MTARQDASTDTQPRDASEVTVAIRAFGLVIGLDLDPEVSIDEVQRSLPPGHERVQRGRLDRVFRLQRLEADASPVIRAGWHWFDAGTFRRFAEDQRLAIRYGESVIEHFVAEHARDCIFIHAGVVTWRGVAVILPGVSRAGKSTLVRALVNASATYFTDEYAVVDPSGTVYPYQRQLSQREGPYGPAGRIDLSAHAPAAADARAGAPVALVALTRFDEDGAWQVSQLQTGAAIMALSQHVVAIRRRPAEAMATMARLAETAVVVEGVRQAADDAAARIIAALDTAADGGDSAAIVARLGVVAS